MIEYFEADLDIIRRWEIFPFEDITGKLIAKLVGKKLFTNGGEFPYPDLIKGLLGA